MLKTIRCPKCNHKTTIEGNPEEIKNIQCPNCGLKGKFTFPKEIEEAHVFEEIDERPLGVTILAVFQIIAIILSIIVLIAIPLIFFEPMNDSFGLPLVGILFLYSFFMLPISLVLAYGLFTGEEWARFSLVLIEITSVIASFIRVDIISATIPVFIIWYLYKPHVKKYFKTKEGLRIYIKVIIIVGFAILLIFNSWMAFAFSPLNMMNKGNVFHKIPDSRYYGTWENETRNIEITFYSNESFYIKNETHSHWGAWDNTVDPWPILILNWVDGEGRYMPLFLDDNRVTFAQESGKSGFFCLAELERKL